jgi:hypothetical protein
VHSPSPSTTPIISLPIVISPSPTIIVTVTIHFTSIGIIPSSIGGGVIIPVRGRVIIRESIIPGG